MAQEDKDLEGSLESTDSLEQQQPKKKRKDRRVEREYYDFIQVKDPISGQLIKQKVKITKYKAKGDRFSYQPAVEENELAYTTIADDEE